MCVCVCVCVQAAASLPQGSSLDSGSPGVRAADMEDTPSTSQSGSGTSEMSKELLDRGRMCVLM